MHEVSIIATKERAEMKMIEFFIARKIVVDGRITTAEAVRQLTVEKALQVRLQNEITRKERIPIDDVSEVIDRVFRTMAAIIKSKCDKVLTVEVINELFAELRSFPDRLNWPGVKLTDLAQCILWSCSAPS